MTKRILVLLGVLAVVAVWLIARQQAFIPPWKQPQWVKLDRGDVKVPITASGLIHARRVIEIKSEASGVVQEVRVDPGDFVKAGDILVVLDPDDEQRLVDRSQAEYERAEALLEQTQIAVRRADVAIANAEAQVEDLKWRVDIASRELNKLEGFASKGKRDLYTEQQLEDARAQHKSALAQKHIAEISVDTAKLTKEDAQSAVKSQAALLRQAEKALDDSRERLRETTIYAPVDAIVTEVAIKPGMLVQSGTQSFMGGTELMKVADVSTKKVVARLDEADYGRVMDITPVEALPDIPGLRETMRAQRTEQMEKAATEDQKLLAEQTGIVKITVDAFPEKEFDGKIIRVEPQGRLNVGSSIIQFDVHVEITDDERHLLPLGAQAQVEFTVEAAHDCLRVPAEAVKSLDDQRGVHLKVEPDRRAGEKWGQKFIACRFGISDGEFTQVIAVLGDNELKEGDEVYTKLPPKPGEEEER